MSSRHGTCSSSSRTGTPTSRSSSRRCWLPAPQAGEGDADGDGAGGATLCRVGDRVITLDWSKAQPDVANIERVELERLVREFRTPVRWIALVAWICVCARGGLPARPARFVKSRFQPVWRLAHVDAQGVGVFCHAAGGN